MSNLLKKKYLVDVPVKTNIWIREDCQRKQFEVIKKARPSILFVISDGGRNNKEWIAIRNNRRMYDEEIDWDCKVYKLYEESNQGMYTMIMKMHEFIWSKVDRCIYLEDDIIPSVSFFQFCAELFDKYFYDPRIYAICGMNHIGINEECSSDYFFSRYGSIWGVGLWRRSYEEFFNLSFYDDPYTMRLLKDVTKLHPSHWKQFDSIRKHGEYDGHIPADEFYMNSAVYSQHQLFIIPKKNMISNIGCQKTAAHGDSIDRIPKGIRKVFNMKTYEVQFPLKAPKYIIPDIVYEKKRNRIMALDHPLISKYRRLERGMRVLLKGDFKTLFCKIKAMKKREK